jgi:actin-related protein 8
MLCSVANEFTLLQIAALMKIPFLDEEMPSLNQPLPPKVLCIVTTCLYI